VTFSVSTPVSRAQTLNVTFIVYFLLVRTVGHRQTKGPATVMPHLHHRATSRLYSFFVSAFQLLYVTVKGAHKSWFHATALRISVPTSGASNVLGYWNISLSRYDTLPRVW